MCSVVILGSWDRGVLNIVFTLIYILKQNRDYRSIYGGGKYRSRARSCLWEGGGEGRGEGRSESSGRGREARIKHKATQGRTNADKTYSIKGKLKPSGNIHH